MRKFLVIAVFAFVTVAMLAPPVLAQAPAPKVTITGLFDQVTSFGKNYSDGNASRDSDHEWYARTRFRPDFKFEVGNTKAVLGLELDLTYGRIGQQTGGPGKNVPNNAATLLGQNNLDKHAGTTADSSLNTDVTGIIEIKWMYTEFDLTGKDSLMPFIPVPSVGRAGLQPFGDLTDKTKIAYATGDFPGFSAVTTFAPNLKTRLAVTRAMFISPAGARTRQRHSARAIWAAIRRSRKIVTPSGSTRAGGLAPGASIPRCSTSGVLVTSWP